MILEEEVVIASSSEEGEDPDIPVDPIVPADIEEQGADNKNTEQQQRQPNRTAKEVINNSSVIGDVTERLNIDERTEVQREEDNWGEIQRYIRSKGLLWGVVKGVEPEKSRNSFSVVTSVFGENVKIPEQNFIVREEMDYNKYYEDQDPEVQYLMREQRLQAYIGAKIPFVLIYGNRVKVQDESVSRGYFYRYMLGGSRVAGMEILQDWWFLHEKKRWQNSRNRIPQLEPGTVIENANVLAAHESGITVEIGGVETYIDRFELITNEYVSNAADLYSAGDTINLLLEKIHINEPNSGKPRVVLRASVRRLAEERGRKVFDDIAIGGLYAGTVSRVSKVKKNYVILLDVGVRCVVSFDYAGLIPLDAGDRVMVRVRRKLPIYTIVEGRVIKLSGQKKRV